jgi:hypothetical protein
MAQDDTTPDAIVLTRVLRLNAVVQGVGVGLMTGLAIFLATNWLVLKGGDLVGPHLALLSQFFIGYRVTFAGSFVGFAYGFVAGFTAGYCVATVYNWIVNLKANDSSVDRDNVSAGGKR